MDGLLKPISLEELTRDHLDVLRTCLKLNGIPENHRFNDGTASAFNQLNRSGYFEFGPGMAFLWAGLNYRYRLADLGNQAVIKYKLDSNE